MRRDRETTSPAAAAQYEANSTAPDNEQPDLSLYVGPTSAHDPAVNEWLELVTACAVEADRLIYQQTGRTP